MYRLLPITSLVRLNWIFSLISSLLVALFLLGVEYAMAETFLRFIQTFLFTSLTSFSNLTLFALNLKHRKEGDKVSNYRFYLYSYVGAILAWLLVKILYSWITGQQWEGEGKYVFNAYMLAILATLCFNTIVLVVQNLVIVQHKKGQSEMENLQLKAYLSDTENLLLRQQIHPHFLFNALNTVKSLYKQDLRQGEEYLIYLANFLRVAVSNHKTQTTLIKNELDFCLDYLKMQKIRFGDSMEYVVNISEPTLKKKYLPYFSLQPLVENVLKHNNLTEAMPVLISIYEDGAYIVVQNNLQKSSHKETSSGSGLYNLSERYRLLGEEGINIKSDNCFFTVQLKILDE